MAKCKGKCYQKQWKVKKGSIVVDHDNVHAQPKKNERQFDADQRAHGEWPHESWPSKLEMEAAIDTAHKQYVVPINEKCKSKDPGRCQCAWPDWGPWMPANEVDGKKVPEDKKWITLTIKVPFQRSDKHKFWAYGWLKVKVRERTGVCIDTMPEPKVSYIPEWGIDLEQELASLSDESLEKLESEFG